MRQFETGATRDSEEGKFDYEGFISPRTLEAYAAYMHENRYQTDGSIRSSDNWQKGMSNEVYMKSKFRHFMDTWMGHRRQKKVNLVKSLCAELFNTLGYLDNLLKEDEKIELQNALRRASLKPPVGKDGLRLAEDIMPRYTELGDSDHE